MRLWHCVFLALALSSSVPAQTYNQSTVAGGAPPVNIPGASAFLRDVYAVAVDGAGNVFFTTEWVVLRLDAITGTLSLAAGNGTSGFSGDDGPATSAQLGLPGEVAVDAAGNLYFADRSNYRIRKVSGGVITTVAGNGLPGSAGDDGPATNVRLGTRTAIAVDSAGNLYISDPDNHRIRKVSGGVITTVAGNGRRGFSGDNGPATSAQLEQPYGIAVDSAGNLYIADLLNHRIRKVSGGVITTVAGNGTSGFSGDNGPATSAQLGLDVRGGSIAVDSAGNLYISEAGNARIRKVSGGVITTVAGCETDSFSDDLEPAPCGAALGLGGSIAVDSAGDLHIADAGNARIRKVSGGVMATVAGGGDSFSGDNGPATSAQLSYPTGVAVDSAGNLYIADYNNNRIRMVSDGVITTVAGNGTYGFNGDNGPATSARLSHPTGVAVDSAGNLYIADYNNSRIRKVSDGVITTVAGDGTPGFSGDNGPATSAQLGYISGVAVDSAGDLYIADLYNNRVRKVSDGVITTVAGGGSSLGNNGPATSTKLSGLQGVAVDSAGNLYIAEGNRIRMVSDGVITTVAGNGVFGFSGDNGPATSAQFGNLMGVAVDSAGDLYISDHFYSRIRKVSAGVIITVAGNGFEGFSGDSGPATSVRLGKPIGVAVDSAGSVYVASANYNRVRLLQPQPFSTTGAANAAGNLPSTSITQAKGSRPSEFSDLSWRP